MRISAVLILRKDCIPKSKLYHYTEQHCSHFSCALDRDFWRCMESKLDKGWCLLCWWLVDRILTVPRRTSEFNHYHRNLKIFQRLSLPSCQFMLHFNYFYDIELQGYDAIHKKYFLAHILDWLRSRVLAYVLTNNIFHLLDLNRGIRTKFIRMVGSPTIYIVTFPCKSVVLIGR